MSEGRLHSKPTVCIECKHFPRCLWMLKRESLAEGCDWNPSRFAPVDPAAPLACPTCGKGEGYTEGTAPDGRPMFVCRARGCWWTSGGDGSPFLGRGGPADTGTACEGATVGCRDEHCQRQPGHAPADTGSEGR